jgi:DNA-binding transcriptional ArsR family regulator
MERVDLILHPVRFRILERLVGDQLTTAEIAERLPDVPKSSVYRHLRLLLAEGMIVVDDTRQVRGVVEKIYRLNQPLHLGAEDVARLAPEEHINYFRNYIMTVMQGFSQYVQAVSSESAIDMATDRAGYTQAFFYATPVELDRFGQVLNEALKPLLDNRPGNRRHKHKLVIITHPEAEGAKDKPEKIETE